MIKKLTKLKIFLPNFLLNFFRKIYFNKLILKLEDRYFRAEVVFENTKLIDPNNLLDLEIKSLIRHNLYERYELEAIDALDLYNDNFIDLGSSIGITALKVARKTSGKKIILVEPIKEFLFFSKQVENLYPTNDYFFINKAINYSDHEVYILKGKNNLDSQISYLRGKPIESTNLTNIVNEFCLESYNLLIDIEGYSFEVIFKDPEALVGCKKIIIEDDFNNNKLENVIEHLSNLGFHTDFQADSRHGFVLGMSKNNI